MKISATLSVVSMYLSRKTDLKANLFILLHRVLWSAIRAFEIAFKGTFMIALVVLEFAN